MRINPISTTQSETLTKSAKKKNLNRFKLDGPVEQPVTDTVSFKGIKNAIKGGSLYALAGAAVGAIAMPAMGVAAGAALLAMIVGGIGAIKGATVNDKENLFDHQA